MVNAIFVQNPESIYDDLIGHRYNFPAEYLGRVEAAVGDWVIVYQGRSGAFGYIGMQQIQAVVPDEKHEGRYNALIVPNSYWDFAQVVPRADRQSIAYEKSLRRPDGRPMSGGANMSAVRKISRMEFDAICAAGRDEPSDAFLLPREASEEVVAFPGFSDEQAPFDGPAPVGGPRGTILMERKYRDPAFQRMVRRAYGGKCAISGLSLRNGGGRPEVQAAHIMPVADGGPDAVCNGLALSGTLHWMFDRGLISVGADMSILVSHNKVPQDVVRRLIDPGQKLMVPKEARHRPHPEFLRYHREEIYGRYSVA